VAVRAAGLIADEGIETPSPSRSAKPGASNIARRGCRGRGWPQRRRSARWWYQRCAGSGPASQGTDEGVEVAIVVDVGQGRRGVPIAPSCGAEGIDEGRREGRGGGRARVLEEPEAAIPLADEDIQIAVAIEVGDGRRRVVRVRGEPERVLAVDGERGKRPRGPQREGSHRGQGQGEGEGRGDDLGLSGLVVHLGGISNRRSVGDSLTRKRPVLDTAGSATGRLPRREDSHLFGLSRAIAPSFSLVLSGVQAIDERGRNDR
jgi:hypothetical protein